MFAAPGLFMVQGVPKGREKLLPQAAKHLRHFEGLLMDEKAKKVLQDIFMAGVRAVDPEEAVKRHIELSGNELRVGGRSYQLSASKEFS